MDFVNPVNSQEKDPTVKRSPLKKALIWCASILVGLILLILALPTILSTDAFLSWALTQANTAMAPATVKVESISLAWFQEQHLTGIHYSDPARGVDAKVKEVTLSSLYNLLPLRKITADVTVDTPEVGLSIPTAPAPGVPVPTPPPSQKVIATTAPRQIVLPAWDFAVNLTVKNGQVAHTILPEPLLSNLACTLSIPSPDAIPTLALNTALLDGTLNTTIQLKPIATLLAAKAPSDYFTSADLSLAAEWAKVALTAAPLANHTYPGGSLSLDLACDKLLTRLRTLNLSLPEDVEALSGSLKLSATLEAATTPKHLRLKTELVSQQLSGKIGGQTLTLSPSLNLIAELNPDTPLEGHIERLSLDFPGLIASGSGSLQSGKLSAQADLNELISTFRPFLNDFTLPKPATLTLTATATPKTVKLDTTLKSNRDQLVALTVNGDGIDLAKQSIASLKTTLQADLARLAPFVPLPEGQTLAGTLLLNTSLTGSLTNWQAKGLVAIRSFTYDSATWQITEPSLLEGEIACSFTEETGISCSNLTLNAPFTTATGSFANKRLSIAGTFIPEKILAYQKQKADITLISEPTWQVTATLGEPITVEAVLNAAPFTVTLPEGFSIDVPLTVKATASVLAESVSLSSYSLATPYLSLVGDGTYGLATKQLSTSGSLTVNIDRLWALPLCNPYREAGFAVSGNHTTPFFLELPLENGLPGILNYGKGEASICFDTITIPGLDIPNGQMKVTLGDAVAALDGTFAVNDGLVSLQPRLLLAEKPIRLELPENTAIFKDIALTQKLFDTHLQRVNPLFTGIVKPGGTIELLATSCSLTLDDPIGTLDTDLVFKTRNCAFVPTGNLNILANLLRLTHRTVKIPDQDFAITIKQSLLTCNPIELNFAPVLLKCSGSTNLKTRELNYLVQLPLTEQLLGRKLSKYLAVDKTLELPIAGTTGKPVMDTSPLLNYLRDSAIGTGVSKLSSRAGKILKKGGEIGLELGGAAEDALETGKEVGKEVGTGAVKALDNVLDSLFKKKKK